MLLKLLLIFASAYFVHCADHNVFKDCSRIDFCSQLRSRTPSYDYEVVSVELTEPSVLTGTLRSTNGDSDLTLVLTGFLEDTLQIQIQEVDSTRYELHDVLDGEPTRLPFLEVNIEEDSVYLTTTENFVSITFSPFNIEFGKNGITEVVFNGDRLTLSKNNDAAPFSLGVTFPEGVQLYGLHEHCDVLALQNTAPEGTDPYRLKNSDIGFYELDSPMALYGAVPVVYGHGPTATAGIFLHNAAQQWIDTTSNDSGNSQVYFMVEAGSLDLFVFLGPRPSEVVRQYITLTGSPHLPQMWALGYHQSRNSYMSQDEVKEVSANFDSHDFPVDVIWLDIDYTDGFRYFTWNPDTFNDPLDLQDTIARTGKKLVTIIDPHVKVEEGYPVYDNGLANDFFVKQSDGSNYEGQCWPGLSTWMDFLNPDARNYYASLYSYDYFNGSTSTIGGIWNDMNEPSVFDNSLEMTLPSDALHFGNVQHRELHNIYGLLNVMATHQGLLQRDDNTRRPFILSRSHFAGSQRYTAIWTGDNQGDWGYLLNAVQACLNANILGIAFCGADVGGFLSNPTTELLERWYQTGAWLPFYRAHYNGGDPREPYAYPEDTQEVIREALQMRYKHLPTWYTLFAEHLRSHDPIIRPMFYQYPQDTNAYKIDNQLLLGSNILVRAVTESGVDNVDVYFPGGETEMWVSATSDDVQMGNGIVNIPVTRNTLPVYYRRGAVIVRKDTVRRNTAEMIDDPYTLYYTLNEDGTAHGTVYLDDEASFKYRDDEDYNYILIDVMGDNVTITNGFGNGNYIFVVEKIIRREIVTMPKEGKFGIYKEIVYTKDVNGVSLKKVKIDLKEKMTIRLQ